MGIGVGRMGSFLGSLPIEARDQVCVLVKEDFDKLILYKELECKINSNGRITFRSMDRVFSWKAVYESLSYVTDEIKRAKIEEAATAERYFEKMAVEVNVVKLQMEKLNLTHRVKSKMNSSGFAPHLFESGYFLKEKYLNEYTRPERIKLYETEKQKPENQSLLKQVQLERAFGKRKNKTEIDAFFALFLKKKEESIAKMVEMINCENQLILDRMKSQIEQVLREQGNKKLQEKFPFKNNNPIKERKNNG